MRVFLTNLGCKLNRAEAEALAGYHAATGRLDFPELVTASPHTPIPVWLRLLDEQRRVDLRCPLLDAILVALSAHDGARPMRGRELLQLFTAPPYGWDGGALVIRDRIQVPAGATLQRAPRASRRHVASSTWVGVVNTALAARSTTPSTSAAGSLASDRVGRGNSIRPCGPSKTRPLIWR